ncbi:hypothetical protein HQ865_22800 [Mucilaginibacter mali]|uniref:Mobilization protein n=1 Tax=Mucilaginibacter mali TaxID=2740462 RepID=A0A7D4QI12_9SPHI|nr:hypothetical protein [Mucilaginibacter mali]QKJ32472.1 hypothetical protein HQ865_22800 [Mucilaginibacter mali]
MRVRSKPLYEYLLREGVLGGTPEAIAAARLRYRQEYKRDWKRRRGRKKEIRFAVTASQFEAVRLRAETRGLKLAAYVRSLALEGTGERVPDDRLLRALQLVGMALTAATRGTDTARMRAWLAEAEALLLGMVRPATQN